MWSCDDELGGFSFLALTLSLCLYLRDGWEENTELSSHQTICSVLISNISQALFKI